MKLKIGDHAPDFKMLMMTDSNKNLYNIKSKFIVLYFYPKDNTKGCTIEANEFNQLKSAFEELGAIIIGISKDDLESHKQFSQEHCLNFDLVSDKDSNVCEEYGVWGERSMAGKTYMGISRTTFLLDEHKRIKHIWQDVSVDHHALEVLQTIKDN
ncbi:MAG: thioredoxin-dependent thiol peroxidase [Rickettsiaceae bacterium]|nr:MAG: thioredoxin-dependent thiol peroxidase [Rickettsiaceae bacterium]